jgi:hypothetical protein
VTLHCSPAQPHGRARPRQAGDRPAPRRPLGLPESAWFGPFLVVQASNGVSLDVADDHGEPRPQHYALLVSEDEFDQIHARIGDRGLECGPR